MTSEDTFYKIKQEIYTVKSKTITRHDRHWTESHLICLYMYMERSRVILIKAHTDGKVWYTCWISQVPTGVNGPRVDSPTCTELCENKALARMFT